MSRRSRKRGPCQHVIDASIARAAGPEGATHPTAKQCRDFLLAVLEVGHQMVFSPAIRAEWNKHQSGFAGRWCRAMFGRKLIVSPTILEDELLRAAVLASDATVPEIEAMEKDCHLIDAAWATDDRVASLDETVRALFLILADTMPRLRDICWVNPTIDTETPLDWLRAGAPLESARCLGPRRPRR